MAREFSRRETPKIELGKLFEKLPPAALEAECALLGSMILDHRVIADVVEIIKGPEDFSKPGHTAIYEALVYLYDHNIPIDVVQLTQRLEDVQQLEGLGGVDYLVMLAESVPSATSAPYYAKTVREKAMLRSLIDVAGRTLHTAYTTADPVEEQLDTAEQAIFSLAEAKTTGEATDLNTLLQETYQKLENHDGKVISGLATGFMRLDELTSGLQNGEMIIVAARPSMGKAQPLSARVLTRAGWKAMGDLKVGDALASVDGAPSQVVGVYPQGERQVYRVTFADGRSTECCAEHLWSVRYRTWDASRVVTTEKLMSMLKSKRYRNRLWVDVFSGDFGCDEGLAMDPWLLGCLLGDGSMGGTSVRFSTADEQLKEKVAQTAGEGFELTYAGGYDYRIKQHGVANRKGAQGAELNPIKTALEGLGLWGCDSFTKFIPEGYKLASKASRVRLLEGLIDTDGWVEKWGSLRLATSSRRLADDVVELVRSLGGTGSWTQKQTTYTHKGRKLAGAPAYVCNLQPRDPELLTLLNHKSERLSRGCRRMRRLNISSIEATRVTATQCIAVSHPSHLYVTDDFVVTHNTAFAVNIAEHIACELKQPIAVFSLEMSKQQLAQRILCSRSRVDSHRLRTNMLRDDDWVDLQRACGELSDAPMFIDDTPGLNLLALRAKSRRLAARYHIRCIVVDYLQLMSGPKSDSREQEVSAISRGIKALARELSLPVICLSQLNRGPESRDGHRPRMSDLRESGSIEQDADVVLMLHREDYYHRGDPEHTDNNIAEVIIAKQRNGPTDIVKLQFDGGTTRFNNLAPGMDQGGGE
jgi:replicative DNA helicase